MTVVPHWSASKFMAWDQCPGEFKARYVDGRPFVMNEAVAFGQAVHQGCEAHYRGEDGISAYRAAWKQFIVELGGFDAVDPSLTGIGMDLLEQVFALGLEGVPERGFSIDTEADLGAPIVGFVDLWGADGTIYDFKTSRGLWSQARAQKELWQPALYSWARWIEEPAYAGEFEYIVLNRITGQLQRFRREWSPERVTEQMNVAWDRMRVIAASVRDDVYLCRGKHGFCQECGDRWGHTHVCNEGTSERIRLRGRSEDGAAPDMP
jgi:hypothetical protein